MKKIRLIVALTCLTLVASSQEQGQYLEDSEIRAHFNLEKNLGKRFTTFLDQQYRITRNMSTFTRASFEFGFTYELNKHIRFLAAYRYIQDQNNSGYWLPKNWYSGGIVLRKSFGYWKIVGRAIVQARNGTTNTDKEFLTKWYNRDKISIRYEINKRLTGFVAEEIYIPLNNPQHMGLDRLRTIAGIVINTTKNQQLELHFMYQQWLQRGGWWDANDGARDRMLKRTYIVGIAYGIEF